VTKTKTKIKTADDKKHWDSKGECASVVTGQLTLAYLGRF